VFQREQRAALRQLKFLPEAQRDLVIGTLMAGAFNRGAEEAIRMLNEEVEGEVDASS
jgi:hypothetical protein